MGGKFKITASNATFSSLLIWGLYGITPILTVVALNNGKEPKASVSDLAGKGYITTNSISGGMYELKLDDNAAVRIASINGCTFEKITV